METTQNPGYYDWPRFEQRCEELARLALARVAGTIDLIVGLETGGAFVAAQLKKLLGVPHMVVLDVVKEGIAYRLGRTVGFNTTQIMGRRVLCVDDSFYRRRLLAELHELVLGMGGVPYPMAIARIRGQHEAKCVSGFTFIDELPIVKGQPCTPSWPWNRAPKLTS